MSKNHGANQYQSAFTEEQIRNAIVTAFNKSLRDAESETGISRSQISVYMNSGKYDDIVQALKTEKNDYLIQRFKEVKEKALERVEDLIPTAKNIKDVALTLGILGTKESEMQGFGTVNNTMNITINGNVVTGKPAPALDITESTKKE